MVGISSIPSFFIKAANPWIIARCYSTAVWLPMKQEQKSLTLCWWSCLGDSGAVIASILASKGAHSLSMCHSDHVMCWLSDSQDQTSLTHHLHSFPEWGNECVTIVFTYKNGEYTHFERMRLCSPFFDNNVHPTISAAALTLTLIASQQSLNA